MTNRVPCTGIGCLITLLTAALFYGGLWLIIQSVR